MTKNTSQPSSLRMAETMPAGMLASTYTRGAPASSPAIAPSPDARVPMVGWSAMAQARSALLSALAVALLVRRGALPLEIRDERVALEIERLALALGPPAADRVLAEQRERDRRIAVRDDRVGQHARVHLPPAHGLRWRCAGQPAPDDLVRGDLDEEVVAALGDAVDLPERRLALQVEVFRRSAAENHAAILLSRQNDRADLVDVEVRVDHQPAAIHELVPGDVHADRRVARRRRVDRHAQLGGRGHDGMLLASRPVLHEIQPEPVVELRRRDGAVHAAARQEAADVLIGFEEHRRGKEDVVDADHAGGVQIAIVQERRSAAQREVQRVVEVVVQVRAGADQEIKQPALHHLDDAAAEPRRRHGTGDRQADGRVVLRREHLVREDLAGFRQPPGVERLEPVVDEPAYRGVAGGPVIPDGPAGEVLARTARGRSGSTMWHAQLLAKT